MKLFLFLTTNSKWKKLQNEILKTDKQEHFVRKIIRYDTNKLCISAYKQIYKIA